MIIYTVECGECGAEFETKDKYQICASCPPERAQTEILDAREEPDWIPVSERPKKEGWYLTINNVGGYRVSQWDKASQWDADWDSEKDGAWVTHWHPLPEPPKQ